MKKYPNLKIGSKAEARCSTMPGWEPKRGLGFRAKGSIEVLGMMERKMETRVWTVWAPAYCMPCMNACQYYSSLFPA